MTRHDRRTFLQHSTFAAGSLALGSVFQNLIARTAGAKDIVHQGYGRIAPVRDEATDLPLIQLPKGFRYRSFGWTNDPLDDGYKTPDSHDGMGVIGSTGNRLTICRNHEVKADNGSFAGDAFTYDPKAGGGCSNLVFDTKSGEFVESRASLAGTLKNCAGGPTPWGTWLSCEETVIGPDFSDGEEDFHVEREHGYIFEVPAEGTASAEPLKAMGRFIHEAVAVDPATGIVYETEDRGTAGFYRFLPNVNGDLAKGGKLEMMVATNQADLRTGLKPGDTFDCSWVPIEEPDLAHSPGTQNELGVYMQGKKQGGSTFARLEGCWYANETVYLVATTGGNSKSGQVFAFSPKEQTITMLYESPSKKVLDKPDNMTVHPGSGGILLCEDGDFLPQRIHGLTTGGQLFPFAANNTILKGERNGFKGDYRKQEWAGATFSPDGKWLFVNLQDPGITLAITGPWENGPFRTT